MSGFTRVDSIDTVGTSYVGNVVTSYDRLVAVFGEPDRTGDDKCQVEWSLRFADGTLATVYDYKEYGRDVSTITDWHVGGHLRSGAAELVCEAVAKAVSA